MRRGEAVGPELLVGCELLAVVASWHVFKGVRTIDDPGLWLDLAPLGGCEFHCLGDGALGIARAVAPMSFDTAEYGHFDVDAGGQTAIARHVGQRVRAWRPLFDLRSHSEIELGVVLTFDTGEVGIANLGDELRCRSWPHDDWHLEATATRPD